MRTDNKHRRSIDHSFGLSLQYISNETANRNDIVSPPQVHEQTFLENIHRSLRYMLEFGIAGLLGIKQISLLLRGVFGWRDMATI